jgi:threonine dehydrogenase-like Zn-dependent dehydrogenase
VAGFEAALAATRPRGTLVLKSTVAGRHELDLAPVVIDEIQVLGSRCGPFAPALEALAAGEIDVASLVEDCLPLARGDAALRRAAERGARKVLVDCAAR